MDYPGYIVVAIWYGKGDNAVYKVGCEVLNPADAYVMDRVFLPDDDTIQFFGCPMNSADIEECWFRVPSTAYSSVSWKWYSVEELEDQAEAKRDKRSAAQRHADEVMRFK